MFQRLSFLAFALIIFECAQGQVPYPGQCPDIKVPTTFNLDAYMGIWYEYAKYPFIFEIGKKCMYANYENIGNNTVSVMNAAINRFTGTYSNITGRAKVIAPGQLAVMFSRNQNTDKPNYLVLGTDYKAYAVVYSCTNFTAYAHTKIVWILTRERKPDQDIVNTAKKIMDDNNLSQTFLMDTIQSNCHEPNAIAESGVELTDDTANAEGANMQANEMGIAAATATAATTTTTATTTGNVNPSIMINKA